MKNYRCQDGCYNCKHVFVFKEYDQGYEYYCTYNAPERPLCMSVAMDECPNLDSSKKFEKLCRAWDKWSEGRRVNSVGICSYYEKVEK